MSDWQNRNQFCDTTWARQFRLLDRNVSLALLSMLVHHVWSWPFNTNTPLLLQLGILWGFYQIYSNNGLGTLALRHVCKVALGTVCQMNIRTISATVVFALRSSYIKKTCHTFWNIRAVQRRKDLKVSFNMKSGEHLNYTLDCYLSFFYKITVFLIL